MKKVISTAVMVCILSAFSGCVQRTIYTHKGNPTGDYGTSGENRRPTSAQTLWFWQKGFWSNES